MVDVSKIVKFVEDKLGTKSNQDGKIQQNNAAEYSLFMAEMGRQVREEGLKSEDFNNMLNDAFGLELSNTAAAARRNAPSGSANGGININITINIDIDIVVKACGGCCEDKEAALQQLVDMLIAEMTREGGSVQNFIVGLINAFSDTSKVDFSNLEGLLNEIMEKLNEQGQKIDDLQNSVNDLGNLMKDQFEALFKTLERYAKKYNIDITEIKDMLNQCNANDKEMLAKIGNVYSAIMDLTNMFQDFTKVEQDRFNQVMNAIANIKVDNGDTEGLMKKLECMHTLLLSIQADTSATKTNSETLINLVKEGKKEILEAIHNINIVVPESNDYDDTEIKNMLNQILTNMVTQGDLDAQLNKFNELIKNLQNAIDIALEKGKREIFEAIHNINIVAPSGSDYDDTEVKNMLTQILSNMVTKGDLDEQLNKFNTLLKNMQNAIEIALEQDKKEILDAIHNINVGVAPSGSDYDDTEVKAMLAEILANMSKLATKDDMKTQFDNQLKQFNQLIENMRSAIECKINASETNIINAMKDIEANIKTAIANISVSPSSPDNSGIISLLNEIMKKLNDMDNNNAQNFSNVFQAIANIKTGEPVDLSAVLKLLNEIKGLAQANGNKLDGVLKNQETIALVLEGIVDGLKKLSGKVDDIDDTVKRIEDIVKKLHNCECECIDENKLREILCEFVQKVHEGVNNGQDISNQLGARAFTRGLEESLGLDSTGIDSVTGNSNKKSSGVYDLSGRPVPVGPDGRPTKPGIYIIDGKKVAIK